MKLEKFKIILANLQMEIDNKQIELDKRKPKIPLSAPQFKDLFLKIATLIIAKRGIDKEFVIDNENKKIINQLYYYITKSKEFNGDFSKGVLIIGNLGTGKTLIIKTIIEIISLFLNIKFETYHAIALLKFLQNNDDKFLEKRPLFIDDLGKETKSVNNYGTISSPISDLFALRYEFGGWTFATSNFTLEKGLKSHYGETITDRFKEIFNIITLSGESRRK